MLNLVRKTNGSTRHLQTSSRSAALVQKQKEHSQQRPVIAEHNVRKEREKEKDIVQKPVKHGALG